MENTTSGPPTRKSGGNSAAVGLIMLIIGIVIGVLVTKYARHGSSAALAHAGNAGGAGDSAASASPASLAPGASSQSGQWDPFAQMHNIQAEIDAVFQRSFADFRMDPKLKVFQKQPGYALSMDVRDLKNQYQVRAFLPDTKTSDVNVKLEGNELKVDVSNKTTEKQEVKNGEDTMTEWGQYEEVVPLAGPLKADQMKVERKEHELIITVPKV